MSGPKWQTDQQTVGHCYGYGQTDNVAKSWKINSKQICKVYRSTNVSLKNLFACLRTTVPVTFYVRDAISAFEDQTVRRCMLFFIHLRLHYSYLTSWGECNGARGRRQQLASTSGRTQMKQMRLKHLSFDFCVRSPYIEYISVPILDSRDGNAHIIVLKCLAAFGLACLPSSFGVLACQCLLISIQHKVGLQLRLVVMSLDLHQNLGKDEFFI